MLKKLNHVLKVLTIVGILLGIQGCSQEFDPTVTTQLAPEEPAQDNESGSSFKFNRYTLTPVANWSIKALVLSTEHYTLEEHADLAPVDIALGWGPMSSPAFVAPIKVRQSTRFYFWRVGPEFKDPLTKISHNSANMHMIPSSNSIKTILKSFEKGDVILIQGKLVNVVQSGSNWNIKTSTSRTDKGAGACEVIYVESAQKVEQPPK